MRPVRRDPRATQASPTTIEVTSEATSRASTIAGRPGKATAVDTSTTGLIAGADSRKASAAAGVTPRETNRPAMGTEPHSQPGRAAPASAATGTARAGRRGSQRARVVGGTKASMAPLTTTPRTRNGIDCTAMATKMVDQLCTDGRSNTPVPIRPRTAAAATRPTSTARPGRDALRTVVTATTTAP